MTSELHRSLVMTFNTTPLYIAALLAPVDAAISSSSHPHNHLLDTVI